MRGIWYENHNLAMYTTWKIGGNAEYFYIPHDVDDLQNVLSQIPQDMPITWLGNGSNVLIRDTGIKGLVICLKNTLQKCVLQNSNLIYAEAGCKLHALLKLGVQNNMLDMLFLTGIPATFGGALYMNAGTNNQGIWQYVKEVTVINRQGKLLKKLPQDFTVSYRKVIGLDENEWFLSGVLEFSSYPIKQITNDYVDNIDNVNSSSSMHSKVVELMLKRKHNQPLHLPNCGSVFRNPQNAFAGKLIEECGLKGVKIGDAEISTQHANFIVNHGKATSADVETLIALVKKTVYEKHGVHLECEVKILGN